MTRSGRRGSWAGRQVGLAAVVLGLALLVSGAAAAQGAADPTPAGTPPEAESQPSSELMLTRDHPAAQRARGEAGAQDEPETASSSPWLLALKIVAGAVALAIVCVVCLPILSGIAVMIQQAVRRLRRRS